MKKRFANTNCLLLLLLILSLLPLLCGCAAQSEKATLYVKKIELDKDEIGFPAVCHRPFGGRFYGFQRRIGEIGEIGEIGHGR